VLSDKRVTTREKKKKKKKKKKKGNAALLLTTAASPAVKNLKFKFDPLCCGWCRIMTNLPDAA